MVLMVKASKTERQFRLTTMQLKKNPNKENSTFVAINTTLKEHNVSKKSLPLIRRMFQEGIMHDDKKSTEALPHWKEVDREAELKEKKSN